MSIKMFKKYMDMCKELNCKPTVNGLQYFKKAFK